MIKLTDILYINLYPIVIRKIRSISIFKRLIYSFICVIIIPSLIIGIVTFEKYSNELEGNMSKYLYYLIDNVSGRVDDNLKKYEDLSYRIYTDEEVISILRKCTTLDKIKLYLPEEYKDYIKYKKDLNNKLYYTSEQYSSVSNVEIITDFDEFNQINSYGQSRGARIKSLESFRNSDNYKKALNVNGYPVWCDTSGEKDIYLRENELTSIYDYITLMRAILDPETRTPLGIIVINIRIKAISSTYSPQELIDKGNLLLVSQKGVICSLNENIHAPTLNNELVSDIMRLQSGTDIRSINGKKCLIVYRESVYTNWILVNVIERDKLIKSAYEILSIIVKISLICIVFALIVSYLVTISISTPLNKMKRAMANIDEGTIEVTYTDNVNDEIGVLGEKFNSMILRIKNLIDKIYEVEIVKKNLEIRRKNAELNALQMQINPHFLYNTLDIMRWEAMFQENGEGKISSMISDFSKLLRMGTKKSDKLILVREELEHVFAYIKVLNYRFKDEIIINIAMDETILDLKIIKLTLQPLVENAITHGFLKKEKERRLTIKGMRAEGILELQIIDNGGGIDSDKLNDINLSLKKEIYEGKSIGIRNVNERIKLHFGEDYGIRLESSPLGTTVIVKIPVIDD